MNVGFIGLGRMGRGMARRILDGGHDLAVFDVVASATTEAGAAGATVGADVADVCRGRDVVITMLVEDADVMDVALRPGGMRDSLARGAIHMAMGTHGVATIRTLDDAHAQAGQVLVAAPVLGRPDFAATGQLGVVPGGPEDAVARCGPLLQVMSRRIFRAGSKPECATAIKLANNAVLGCAIVAMAESFALVRKYGVMPQVFQDVMVEGLFGATAYTVYGQKMVDESYDEVGSPVSVGLKDARLIAAAAELAHVAMPGLEVYLQHLRSAVTHGAAHLDQAVLARDRARMSGLE